VPLAPAAALAPPAPQAVQTSAASRAATGTHAPTNQWLQWEALTAELAAERHRADDYERLWQRAEQELEAARKELRSLKASMAADVGGTAEAEANTYPPGDQGQDTCEDDKAEVAVKLDFTVPAVASTSAPCATPTAPAQTPSAASATATAPSSGVAEAPAPPAPPAPPAHHRPHHQTPSAASATVTAPSSAGAEAVAAPAAAAAPVGSPPVGSLCYSSSPPTSQAAMYAESDAMPSAPRLLPSAAAVGEVASTATALPDIAKLPGPAAAGSSDSPLRPADSDVSASVTTAVPLVATIPSSSRVSGSPNDSTPVKSSSSSKQLDELCKEFRLQVRELFAHSPALPSASPGTVGASAAHGSTLPNGSGAASSELRVCGPPFVTQTREDRQVYVSASKECPPAAEGQASQESASGVVFEPVDDDDFAVDMATVEAAIAKIAAAVVQAADARESSSGEAPKRDDG